MIIHIIFAFPSGNDCSREYEESKDVHDEENYLRRLLPKTLPEAKVDLFSQMLARIFEGLLLLNLKLKNHASF